MTPEPLGSLAEEAAKLVAALSSSPSGGRPDDANDGDHPPDHGHANHDPLSAECRYCPLCALARAARSMTPEVREHLASAATSLLLAARGFVEEAMAKADGATDGTPTPVEKIDVAED
jgi:hypothetical protein